MLGRFGLPEPILTRNLFHRMAQGMPKEDPREEYYQKQEENYEDAE